MRNITALFSQGGVKSIYHSHWVSGLNNWDFILQSRRAKSGLYYSHTVSHTVSLDSVETVTDTLNL